MGHCRHGITSFAAAAGDGATDIIEDRRVIETGVVTVAGAHETEVGFLGGGPEDECCHLEFDAGFEEVGEGLELLAAVIGIGG